MSTILDALRKAKQFPQQESVDARHEILSPRSHNYLATVPGAAEGHLRFLKIAVLSAAAIIFALMVVIALLILFPRDARQDNVQPDNSGQSEPAPPQATPLPAVAQQETPAPPPVRRVEIVVATPQPTPTAPKVPLQPTPTAPGPSVTAPAAANPGADPGTSQSLETTVPGAAGAIGNLRLSGIAWDSADPMAMINGRPVREGSEIGGGSVLKINRDSVVILVNGQEYVLRP